MVAITWATITAARSNGKFTAMGMVETVAQPG